jgi:hypothetical protein
MQDIGNTVDREVERFAALTPKLMTAPLILTIHPGASMPLSIGVKRGVGHCFVAQDRKTL